MSVRFLSVLVCLCCSISNAEEIPLGDIWAYNMPGTQRLTLDRQGPQSGYASKHGALVEAVYSLFLAKENDPELGPAIVVKGTGIEALKNLESALTDKIEVPTTFSTEQEISIVFFAIGRHEDVHLTRALRTGVEVQLFYKFVPHVIGPQTTIHFAIIPIGKLPKGVVNIGLQWIPFAKDSHISPYQIPTREEVKRIVCQPFEFSIE